MSNADLINTATERLTVSRLGKLTARETDKDLIVIKDLIAEVTELDAEKARMIKILDNHLPTIITGLWTIVSATMYQDRDELTEDVVAARAAYSAAHWIAKDISGGKGEPLYDLPSVLDLLAQPRQDAERVKDLEAALKRSDNKLQEHLTRAVTAERIIAQAKLEPTRGDMERALNGAPSVPTDTGLARVVEVTAYRAKCPDCVWTSGGADLDKSMTEEKCDAHNNIIHADD